MEQSARKSKVLRTIFISITLLIDGLSAFAMGNVYLFFMVMMDPEGQEIGTKTDNFRQGEVGYVAGLVVLLVFILAAIFWWLGKRVGKYVATTLCIVGLLSSCLYLMLSSTFWPFLLAALVLGAFNILSLKFIFTKGKPAIVNAEPSGDPTT